MNHYYGKTIGECCGFNFQDVYSLMVKLSPNPAKFVEVGCAAGQSLVYLAVEIINVKKIFLYTL